MTEREAQIHLGVAENSSEETIIDAFEQKVFEFKNQVFSEAPVLKLWWARLSRLKLANEARKRLLNDHSSVEALDVEMKHITNDDPVAWLQNYQHERSRCFLQLQALQNPDHIHQVVAVILQLEEQLKKHYLKWFNHWFSGREEEHEVFLKNKLEVGLLSWQLQRLQTEKVIEFKLGQFQKTVEKVDFEPELHKEFIRLKKLTF